MNNIGFILFLCVLICLDHHYHVSAGKHGDMILMPAGGKGPMIISIPHKKKKHHDL